MANTINWGKIYESTYWGNTDNNISWGKAYADLAGVVPALVSEFVSRVEADGGSVESTECMSTDLTFLVNNPEPVAFTGLLNDYSGAAAAYSLRLLDNTYSGNAIKVRRSSDNAEQDIAFVNNELDTASLETFAGSGDAFVTTWYDQSGNGVDAANASASSQPKIVSSGSTILENGKAAVEFDGSDDYLYSSTFSQSQPNTIFAILKQTRTNIGGESFLQSTNNNSLLYSYSTTNYALYAGIAIEGDTTNTNQNLYYGLINGLSSSLQTNNSTEYSGDTGNGIWTDLYLSGRDGASNFSAAKFQEIIVFSGNKSTDKNDIQTNINDFYSIY